ncbi:uncharacterized protein LOC143027710 [Oratosquilla oratoria]|uniref:uncharacterized protein LOC143027710 n=1 Tax=Oratosquilla oratoria TaxID=337810 RepID=UPI003F7690E2
MDNIGSTTWMFLLLLLASLQGGTCNMRLSVEIPQYAFAGGAINISCFYELQITGLYSLKWYHNRTEFYRYVPTEEHRPVHIKPRGIFETYELSRTDHHVTLLIKSLTPEATGEYACEVIAEHPSFRTEAGSDYLTVLREPLSPPVLKGVRQMYEPTELINIQCHPNSFPLSGPKPNINWYIQGRPARREYVSSYHEDPYAEALGATLQIPASEVSSHGGTLEVECRIALGKHTRRTTKTLRVRKPNTYLYNYFSSGKRWKGSCHLFVLALFLTFILQDLAV